MFDFTKELILNNVAASIVALTDADDLSIPTGESAVLIKRYGKFYAHDSVGPVKTTAIYKTVGFNPVNEVATFNCSNLVPADLVGKVLRLSLDVKLLGSQASDYSRWAVNKGQPFFVEFYVDQVYGSATLLVAAMAAAFNKGIKKGTNTLYTELLITASTTNLLVTATNEHQRISGIIERIDSAYDVLPVTLTTATVTTVGKEGFGTSWFITKNLRLPTIENLRFMGEGQDERPIEGTLYNQYVLTVESDRGPLTGQGAVGQKLASKTTHVVYVPQAQDAAFLAAVSGLVTAVVTVP
jgi:hypothetical protein